MWIRPCDNRPWVSIHLMLLFIEGTKDTIDNSGKFQYISCYSLSGRHSKIRLRSYCFNTSHVTLYRKWIWKRLWKGLVSIHLMLLFIFVKCASDAVMRTFQYISCYSLSTCWKPCISEVKFQYISCYSLSTKKRKLVISLRCFNTSHVTLYLLTLSLLEALGHVSIHLMLLFIDMQATGMWRQQSFNTSHVTLYRQRAGKIWQTVICFNTSHVTLYQDKSISIIRKQTRFNTSHVTLYQNVDRVVKLCIRCFNTSHVTLYHNMVSALPGEKTFQYISCYSLSGVNADWINTGARFNTSHVTLYR